MRLMQLSLLGFLSLSLCSPLAFAQDRENLFDLEYTYSSPEEVDEGNVGLLNDDLEIHEGRAGAVFGITDQFDLGVGYRVNVWDPDQDEIDSVDLHKVMIPMWYDIDVSEAWTVTLNAAPGVHTDFEDVDEDDFRVQGGGWVTYALNPDLAFALGVMYSDEFGEAEAYPIGGVRWQATDALLLDIMLPFPRVSYATSEWFTVYLFAEPSGGEWNVGNSDMPQVDISQEGIRVGGGAEVLVGPNTWFYLAGGGEFEREYQIAADGDAVFDDEVDLDNAGFVRVGLRVAR